MLKASDILERNRATARAVIAAHHGMNPRVFGSVLHGTDTASSDIDILIEVPPGTGLLALGAMQCELEEVFGIPVDVVTQGDLPPRFRDTIVRSARPL